MRDSIREPTASLGWTLCLSFRLIGIGAGKLTEAGESMAEIDFFKAGDERSAKIEQAIDKVRTRFGDPAIFKGRSLPDDK